VRVDTGASALRATGAGARERIDLRAPDGSTVAVHELDAGTAPADPASGADHHQLMIVLDGWAAVIDASGRVGRIDAGDVALLPRATPIQIHPGERLRRIVVAFEPGRGNGAS
jgi:hypothetical protein